jgi:hypothetical protein
MQFIVRAVTLLGLAAGIITTTAAAPVELGVRVVNPIAIGTASASSPALSGVSVPVLGSDGRKPHTADIRQ